MSNLKNISIDAIERKNDQEWQHNVKTNTFNAKNYLNVKLDKGQDEKKIYIRLLTVDKDSNSPFKHIKMHNCRVPAAISGNGFKSYVCLYHTKGEYTEELGEEVRLPWEVQYQIRQLADEFFLNPEKALGMSE